jgi:trehalose 6-phosphate phosphatase
MKRHKMPKKERRIDELPSALKNIDCINRKLEASQSFGMFLDYDGTLTPIVERPEDAVLSDGMRYVLKTLATRCMVTIISGRGLKDVRERVGLEDIYYAGSHGFEIAGPGNWYEEYPEAKAFLPLLDQMEGELHRSLGGISGLQVERKRYSIAVHYRRASEESRWELEQKIPALKKECAGKMRLSSGKCVYEFQPDIHWHKGKALLWILESAFASPDDVFVIYIGDDITDEDAFREIRDIGTGIAVKETDRPTDAVFALANPDEVALFLETLTQSLKTARW